MINFILWFLFAACASGVVITMLMCTFLVGLVIFGRKL